MKARVLSEEERRRKRERQLGSIAGEARRRSRLETEAEERRREYWGLFESIDDAKTVEDLKPVLRYLLGKDSPE